MRLLELDVAAGEGRLLAGSETRIDDRNEVIVGCSIMEWCLSKNNPPFIRSYPLQFLWYLTVHLIEPMLS